MSENLDAPSEKEIFDKIVGGSLEICNELAKLLMQLNGGEVARDPPTVCVQLVALGIMRETLLLSVPPTDRDTALQATDALVKFASRALITEVVAKAEAVNGPQGGKA